MDDAVAQQRARASATVVAPSAPPSEPATSHLTTLTAAPAKPARRRTWIWGVVAGAVVVVAAGVTVGVVLGTSKKDPTPQLGDVRF